MPQLRRKLPGSGPSGGALDTKDIARDRKVRRLTFIFASVVIILIPIIIGVSLYVNAAPFRKAIITVDDASINMGYFLKRAKLAEADIFTMLDVFTDELILKIEAPRYGIEVSPEDVDQQLRSQASGEGETISDSEFKEWYRQILNETGFSDSEYRELIATNLLAARLQEYLAERVPTVAEQCHLHIIALETYEDAEEVRARWEEGEDFATLAREVSVDESSKEGGGDIGWIPRGVLSLGLDDIVFNLDINEVSDAIEYSVDPTSYEGVYYYLFMVSEKADARVLDEDILQVLKNHALDDWLTQERPNHEVTWHGLNNGFDSETISWISWQLSKE